MLGVCKVNLGQFLEPSENITNFIQNKYRLFPNEVTKNPEFFYPVVNEESKMKVIMAKLAPPEEKKAPEPIDPKNAKKGGKEPPKKEVKKEVKKPAGGKKDTIPEKKIVPVLDWPQITRDKVLLNEKESKFIEAIPGFLLAVKVEILLDEKSRI